jgi:hypothetical protein
VSLHPAIRDLACTSGMARAALTAPQPCHNNDGARSPALQQTENREHRRQRILTLSVPRLRRQNKYCSLVSTGRLKCDWPGCGLVQATGRRACGTRRAEASIPAWYAPPQALARPRAMSVAAVCTEQHAQRERRWGQQPLTRSHMSVVVSCGQGIH